MNPLVERVTERIRERSASSRSDYLRRIEEAAASGVTRARLSCSNLAHGMAACPAGSKTRLSGEAAANVGIVSAYNDMLSAHQPYEGYPELIRRAAEDAGAVAQVAGGVPAMCDGITQGRPGMELSLFSRDVIAMSTALALSHDMFDAVVCLGVCDKIVPGLLMGALAFGHLPAVFVPAGPMPSGLPNKEKARVREAYAAGEAGRVELIAAESAAYHSPGTCTFYGTANSNQMLLEFMGLQLPGGSFVNPGSELRDLLTAAAVRQVLELTRLGNRHMPIGRIVDESSVVNAVVGLLASGGSTNHTMHLVAVAAAAGIRLDWSDFADLSRVVPLMARVYPNGEADVNHFHDAGGLGFMIGELLDHGLLHDEVETILGRGLSRFVVCPERADGALRWRPAKKSSADPGVLRGVAEPFDAEGGLRVVQGDVGRAVVKVSAVRAERRRISAPARVFVSQDAFAEAFEAEELEGDMVAVLPWQGPRANGMPELHRLSPYLGVLERRGYRVALLTDGRMSGASGAVLAAIQVTPEAASGGLIGRIRDGDLIHIDADAGAVRVEADLEGRTGAAAEAPDGTHGTGRELFAAFRAQVGPAESGASIFGPL